MKNLIKSFNTPETLLVITSFPEVEKNTLAKKGFNAIGWHSERILKALAKKRNILVCAEEMGKSKDQAINKNLLVTRQWKKSNPLSFISLARFIFRLSRIKSVFVQFEFNVFGGILPNLALITLLGLLRLTGRRVTFELHQVITDIAKLEKHIHITNPVLQKFFNMSLALFYRILGLVTSEIIVFEQELKNKLQDFIKADKITVLSLAVEKRKTLPIEKARKALKIPQDEFVVLLFGFINGYKGIDWILKTMRDLKGKKIRLLIAGGENPYLKDKPEYQAFYQSVLTQIKKHAYVTHNGFIPEEEITTYFSASDVLALPYEVFMSASGPFSHALMYEKPVLISERLADYSQSKDFQKALTISGLTTNDLVFTFTRASLMGHINTARTDRTYYAKLKLFVKTLGALRSMDSVSSVLDTLLFPVQSVAVLSGGQPQLTLPSSLTPIPVEA